METPWVARTDQPYALLNSPGEGWPERDLPALEHLQLEGER